MIEIRSFLRDATNELHRELDTIVGVFSSRSEYASFLQGTFRHRAPVEAALLEAVAGPSPWRPRKLLPELTADLADLGLPLPTAAPLHLSNDIAAQLGAAYVLEGSALGARVLVKGVENLGFGADFGARYLSAQAGSLDQWRAVLVALEGLERQAWDAAAQSARAVFFHAIQAFTSEELAPA